MTMSKMMGATMVLCLSALVTTDAAAQQGRGGGMMGGRGIAALLTNEGVQKELKLDEGQVEKSKELATKAREKMMEAREGLQNLEAADRLQKMRSLNQEINASIKKDAAEFLKPEQLTRLTQIDYQNRGVAIFSDPEVAAKLKITEDQKEAMKEIESDTMREIRSILTQNADNLSEAAPKLTELQKAAKTKAEAKLNEEQAKQWKEMIGAPFEVKFQPRPRRDNN